MGRSRALLPDSGQRGQFRRFVVEQVDHPTRKWIKKNAFTSGELIISRGNLDPNPLLSKDQLLASLQDLGEEMDLKEVRTALTTLLGRELEADDTLDVLQQIAEEFDAGSFAEEILGFESYHEAAAN